MQPRSLLVVVSLTLFSAALQAADWPQWRGPDRDGISPETGLLDRWPEGGPKLLWQARDIAAGYSTPSIVGRRLYLLRNEGTDDEFVQARSVEDGSHVWSTRIGRVGPNRGPQYPGARSTPTIDGERLYALGSDGDLVCLAAATGKQRWHRNLRDDFDGRPGNWAYSESPLIDGDVVVVTPGGSDATMVALNKQNGEVVWEASVPGGDEAAYASAIIVEAGGVKQYVQFLEHGLVGIDAETGKFLWRYDRTAQGSPANIPTPLARNGYVYSASGRGGAALIKLEADQGNVEVEEVYFSTKLPTALGGAVRVGDYLYGTTGQGLVCAEFATGAIQWQDRSIGPASVCYADGHLYLHGENGEVALVEATPEGYREKGRFSPPDQPDRGRAKAWAYPAIADGRLYIRDQGMLWCYDVSR